MNNFKTILGVETSCDETAAAVLSFDPVQDKQKGIHILSNVVASSKDLQSKYGGIIPEQAAREQLKSIIPVIEEALIQASIKVIPARRYGIASPLGGEAGIHKKSSPSWIPDQIRDDMVGKIDAIAVTFGPGLIGSLLVGVETAKVLSLVWNKPLVPVNHLLGHFYANWIDSKGMASTSSAKNSFPLSVAKRSRSATTIPIFPCIGLLVSGGHTDLVLFKDHGRYEYLGGTRDDAAGECFDKCARLLGLPYPGGPQISKLAEKGDPKSFKLPRPMIDSDDFDFSYSGLKTAVANLVDSSEFMVHRKQLSINNEQSTINNLCASIEAAIIDPLVKKTFRAAQKYGVEQIIVAGGVAANQKLISDLKLKIKTPLRGPELKIALHVPPPSLCTDNGAMIAAAAFFEKPIKNPLLLQANPNLSL